MLRKVHHRSGLALGTTCMLATITLATPAGATAGGAQAPAKAGGTGGAEYGQPIAQPRDPRPVATFLRITPGEVTAGRALPAIRFRIDQKGVRSVRARLVLWPARGQGQLLRVGLGTIRTGRAVVVRWPAGTRLRAGTYTVRLHATAPDGATLLRRAKASGRAALVVKAAPVPKPEPASRPVPAPSVTGLFPVQGAYDLGGEDARFGADRDDHIHEGQDITALRGVPVVAPLGGVIRDVGYQRDGAGWFVVQDSDDGRSFFFAHCRADTVVVDEGQRVAAGARLCDVGNTGASSGPHLHFEIWLGGWRVNKDSYPIDPLPQLREWAS